MLSQAKQGGASRLGPIVAGLGGGSVGGGQVVRDLVEECVLGEQVEIDSLIIGEHYRDDVMDSTREVECAALAGPPLRPSD